MKLLSLIFACLLSMAVYAEEITFHADDGVQVFADWYPSERADAATIVLFHQAGGSARGEYPYIIKRLGEWGVHVLAVDQRSGGDRFGTGNRTVDALGSDDATYCDAIPDLIAAIAHVHERADGPVIIWGSSYSAGLVLRLAATAGQEIDAALAFSPASGGPMAACSPADIISDIKIPVAAFRPSREMELESVQLQADALRSAGIRFYVIKDGVHGSSMLVPERSQADMDLAWHLVEEFLAPYLNR